MHPAELTVCCRLIRISWHRASCPREILRFSTVSSPEVQKRRGADVDFQAAWAHVCNQEHQVSPRGASDWWRELVRKSVSVHQEKFRGSAISGVSRIGGRRGSGRGSGDVHNQRPRQSRPEHQWGRGRADPHQTTSSASESRENRALDADLVRDPGCPGIQVEKTLHILGFFLAGPLVSILPRVRLN